MKPTAKQPFILTSWKGAKRFVLNCRGWRIAEATAAEFGDSEWYVTAFITRVSIGRYPYRCKMDDIVLAKTQRDARQKATRILRDIMRTLTED